MQSNCSISGRFEKTILGLWEPPKLMSLFSSNSVFSGGSKAISVSFLFQVENGTVNNFYVPYSFLRSLMRQFHYDFRGYF